MARPSERTQLDLGRLLCRLLCALFALVGALPLAGGLLVRSAPVRDWAARETRQVLAAQLGVSATYRVEMGLWPLRVSLHDLVVPATDGGPPALRAERIAVTPRIFSLLAGRLDVGDIELDAPHARLVIRDGEVRNVKYRLPKTAGPSKKLTRAPFTSLAVSDARIDVDVDGVKTRLESVDLDVFGDAGPSFEIVLRAGASSVARERLAFARKDDPSGARPVRFDDDAICRFDLRARWEPGHALVRRLSLLGVADGDPAAATTPSCTEQDDADPRRVAIAVTDFRVELGSSATALGGQLSLRAPTRLTNRFVPTGDLQGYAQLSGTFQHDGRAKLPEFRGKLTGQGLGIEGYRLAERLDADVLISSEVVYVPRLFMRFADGDVHLKNAKIEPFGANVPLHVERVDGDGMQFTGLMRDLDVTPGTIVNWDLNKTHVTNIRGRIAPVHIDADIVAETRDFEVFDRAFSDPARRHVIGVRAATVRGKLGVRPNAFEIYDTRAEFPGSSMFVKLVSIGFSNELKLQIAGGSKLDLAKISPLLDIPMSGLAEFGETKMQGVGSDPVLEGTVAIQNFVFGGFPIGDLLGSKVRFRPLKVDISEGRGRKGKSEFTVPSARLDFDTQASIVVDADVQSRSFDIRDFFAIWLFDKDPRFDQIHGKLDVQAKVHYALGGPEDRCTGGRLHVEGAAKLAGLDLFEERYDSGHAQFDFDWIDRYASYLGFDLEVPSITLRKGEGVIFGSMSVKPGARLAGNFVATGVPVSRIDAMAGMTVGADAQVSGVAELGGTVDAMKITGHGRGSPVRIGNGLLPGSDLDVTLEPIARPLESSGTTRCGRPVPTPFDPAEYAGDRAQGTFHVKGDLFGGQIKLQDLQITRQRAKIVRGGVDFAGLDLGALAELAPQIALSNTKLSGRLTARADIAELPMQNPSKARLKLAVSELKLERAGLRAELVSSKAPLTLEQGTLQLPGLALAVASPAGQSAVVDVQGKVSGLGKVPQVAADVALRPIQLSALTAVLPRVERAAGTLGGDFHVQGRLDALRYSGAFNLKGGELALRGLPAPITNAELQIQLDNDEIRLASGTAKMGAGTLKLRGSAPLRGMSLGSVRIALTARDINYSGAQGIKALADADLITTWEPSVLEVELPEVTGSVTLKRFEYTRPVIMTADLSTLAQRGKRTEVETYDPEDDTVRFDVNVHAVRPLQIHNDLTESELEFENGGLQLAGTNQRFGLRGALRLKPGGKIRLRRNEFEVRQGFVRFDDLTRIAAQVDVTAVTEYRRYGDSMGSSTEASSGASASAGRTASAAGGHWRITMRAHGDADKLKVDLTSEPALAQDDIFLLLTVGLTRAELDQARSASAGESVALEALGTLTGADRAVAQAVPVIDEFRFGSAYSPKTGRTEPTITVGKRLAERLRANVTSGLSESREVRSNVEWRLNPRVSVEGSYDNVNDISNSSLGNVGADIRWRLEFE